MSLFFPLFLNSGLKTGKRLRFGNISLKRTDWRRPGVAAALGVALALSLALAPVSSGPGDKSESFLLPAPEAERHLQELRQLFERASEGESARRACEILAAHGREAVTANGNLVSLKAVFLAELPSHPDFSKILKQQAAAHVEALLARAAGDTAALERAIAVTAGLGELRAQRLRLLDEFLDRGELLKAEAQAQAILEEGAGGAEPGTRARLMVLQARLGRASAPPASSERVRFKGETLTLDELHRRLAANNTPVEAGIPGRLAASWALPLAGGASLGQSLEPAASGNLLALATPRQLRILSARSATPLVECGDEPGGARVGLSEVAPLHEPAAFPAGVVHFVSSGESRLGLRATSWQGRVLWNSRDHEAWDAWAVCGPPRVCAGWCYAPVMDARGGEETTLGLARADLGNGALDGVLVLQSSTVPRERLRMAARLASAGGRLYGLLGTGLAFGLDARTFHLQWTRDLATGPGSPGAAPWLGTTPGGLAAYEPSLGTLHVLDGASGARRWERQLPGLGHIHAADSLGFLYSTPRPGVRGSELVLLNLENGQELWRQTFAERAITGEGEARGGHIVLPVSGGLAVLGADGREQRFLPMPESPDKARWRAGTWLIFAGRRLHAFEPRGDFTPPAPAPPCAESEPPEPAAHLAGFADPYPERSLACPFEAPEEFRAARDFWARARVHLGIRPRHHVLQLDDELCLLREGGTTAGGARVLPAVLWSAQLPNARVAAGRLLAHDGRVARVFDAFSLHPLYAFDARAMGQEIRAAALNSRFLAVELKDGEVEVLDAPGGRHQLRFKLQHDFSGEVSLDGTRFVARLAVHGDEKLACYDLDGGGQLLWKAQHPEASLRPYRNLRVLAPLPGGAGERWRFVNERTGRLIPLKDLPPAPGAKWIFPAQGGGDLALCADGSIFGAGGKSVKLATLFKVDRGHQVPPSVAWRGDRIFVIDDLVLHAFARADGTALGQWRVTDDSLFLTHPRQLPLFACLLEESVLSVQDGTFIFYRDLPASERGGRQVCVLTTPDTDVDARRLYAVDPLDAGAWVGPASARPAGAGEFRQGADEQRVHFLLRLPAAAPGVRRVLQLSGSWSDFLVYWIPFYLRWELDVESRCRAELPEGHGLSAVRSFAPDGTAEIALSFSRSALRVQAGRPMNPWTQLEIAYECDGRPEGCYRLRAIAKAQPTVAYGLQRFTELPTLEDYEARQKLYAAATGLFSEGRALAEFLEARRCREGVADNRPFLRDLLARVGGSYGSIQVLSALFAEELRWLKADLGRTAQDLDAFPGRCHEVARRLAKDAEPLKLPPDWLRCALSVFLVRVIPNEKPAAPFRFGPTLRHSPMWDGQLINDIHYQVTAESLYYTPEPTPYFLTLYAGLFDARHPLLSGLFFNRWARGPADRISSTVPQVLRVDPAGAVELRSVEGRNAEGVSGADESSLGFPQISFGEAPVNFGLDPLQLRMSLELLPPASRYGPTLAEACLASTPAGGAGEREILGLLLARTAGNPTALEDAAAFALRRLRAADREFAPACGTIAALLGEAHVGRALQRRVFLGLTNAFAAPEAWCNLGAVPARAGFDPPPENAPWTPGARYTSGNAQNGFEAPRPEHGATGTPFFLRNATQVKEDSVAYHATVLEVSKAQRAFLHLGMMRPWPRHQVSVWLRGECVANSVDLRMPEVNTLPLRLVEGSNPLLVRIIFNGDWSLLLSVGGTVGAPLEGVRLRSPLPAAAPSQEAAAAGTP